MARTVRSAKGVMVDFDLLRIKENLGSVPKATTVRAREDFIDQKMQRKLRRMADSAVTPIAEAVPVSNAPVVEESDITAKKKIIAPAE